MTVDEDVTMMPMNEVIPKPIGIVKSWAQIASLGFRANCEKSGSFTIRVAKFPMQLMIPFTNAQRKALP